MVVSQENGGALVLFESTGVSYGRFRAHKISAAGEKLWGPLGQPVSGLTTHGEDPIAIEGVPLAGGGAVFAEGNGNIWALRAKLCDTPPAAPIVISPYRRCTPGTYSITIQSSGCLSGSFRYFTASDGLRLLTETTNTQIGLGGRDTTQYIYAECIVNGCASVASLTPAHIQIAETSYTNAQLPTTYPKTANDLPALVLSQTTITAQNLVNPPANVLYEATQAVRLDPGFQANPGAVFRAEVKTCVNVN